MTDCPVCQHAKVQAINQALRGGRKPGVVAAQYRLERALVFAHRQHLAAEKHEENPSAHVDISPANASVHAAGVMIDLPEGASIEALKRVVDRHNQARVDEVLDARGLEIQALPDSSAPTLTLVHHYTPRGRPFDRFKQAWRDAEDLTERQRMVDWLNEQLKLQGALGEEDWA